MSEFKDFLNESSSGDFKKDLIKLRKKYGANPNKKVLNLIEKMQAESAAFIRAEAFSPKDIQRWIDIIAEDADDRYYDHESGVYGAKTPDELRSFLSDVKKNIKVISAYFVEQRIDTLDAIIKLYNS